MKCREGCVQFGSKHLKKMLQMLLLSPGLQSQEDEGDWSVKRNWIDKRCLV